jgi:regulator of sigma E protease
VGGARTDGVEELPMHEMAVLVGVAVIAFLSLITVIAIVHEFGHYLAARACGVAVLVFSIGFGRELIGWTGRSGTRWRLCLLPLGGYLKLAGEDGTTGAGVMREMTAAERRASFFHRPLRHRAVIVLAGPLANLLFAVLAMALLTFCVGRNLASPEIATVAAESPAAAAGFRPGDRILDVDGAAVDSFTAFTRLVAGSPAPVTVRVQRGEATATLVLRDGVGEGQGRIGLTSAGRVNVGVGPVGALRYGVEVSARFAETSLGALRDLMIGAASAQDIAGPVRVAQVSGQITMAFGLGALVLLGALLSVNVAVFNLLPVPALDGGHLLFMVIEKLRGRPLPRRVQRISALSGFALVIVLCVVMTANDVINMLG